MKLNQIKIFCWCFEQYGIAQVSRKRMDQEIVRCISSVIPRFPISFRFGSFLVYVVTRRIRDIKKFGCLSLS